MNKEKEQFSPLKAVSKIIEDARFGAINGKFVKANASGTEIVTMVSENGKVIESPISVLEFNLQGIETTFRFKGAASVRAGQRVDVFLYTDSRESVALLRTYDGADVSNYVSADYRWK